MTPPNYFLSKLVISGLMLAVSISGFSQSRAQMDDNFHFAKQHKDDLTLSVYITAHSVDRLLSTPEGRREATSLMMANGITKAYVEVYRGGLVVSPSLLTEVTKYFNQNGFEVVGGIATVPGGDIGVKGEGDLGGWFNWQNPKTQQDMRKVMLDVAPIFDTFIIDDFLCTEDTSPESKTAKGDRSWSEYRRQMLTELATSIFIEPAKSVNPDIHMIIKYPQWYDRFHVFGYDVESGPRIFDEVWVGTETRGQYTQRFGFVQPYEGFVNYSWIKSIAGKKIGGAWFDYIDCDALDFIEQAYQSVLAGANELVIFNYGSFVNGHPGHHLLRMDFEKLARLAKAVRTYPIHGIAGYKPPSSDPGGDMYIMDFIGMFGIPLIPTAYYPESAATIVLPTQAASDPEIVGKVVRSHKQGKRIIMTAGFLAKVDDQGKLAKLAGIEKPTIETISAEKIVLEGSDANLEKPLDLEAVLEAKKATVILEAKSGNRTIPFLTQNKNGQIYVLNSHTFSDADFKAVGEVLLSPRPLGLLDLPAAWANVIRNVFNEQLQITLSGPTRITMQPMENGDIILHNYNNEAVELQLNGWENNAFLDAFTGEKIGAASGTLKMKPRSRVWLASKN
ncbi:hypothetical protein K8352_14695 [Flavobacteriaceae bacterium F89]|uniref:Uncharacterized protein n=1 Tax=Cerina litoralis TaxID=2874477 RepID=A0AAE3EVX3_9FLAO|nr:hypothetical protein [Cerina litoralis]MCG2462005.1 hypothetical protein [Cerina litoralis]